MLRGFPILFYFLLDFLEHELCYLLLLFETLNCTNTFSRQPQNIKVTSIWLPLTNLVLATAVVFWYITSTEQPHKI